MQYSQLADPRFGESLYATNGTVELYIPLTYGMRIAHFSFCGGQNVFFEQPADMTELTQPEGWRIRGGHRLWVSPEDDRVYFPDNAPITYRIEGDTIVLTQPEDTWQKVNKWMEITFGEDASVKVLHRVQNADTQARYCALWPISVMAPGGTEHIPLLRCDNGDTPSYWLSLWDYANLNDKRVTYLKDEILLTHDPEMLPRFKLGISRLGGPARYENRGVIFEKDFAVTENVPYPDNHVTYETFLSAYMTEIESLSPLMTLAPGECGEHTEVWRLRKTL